MARSGVISPVGSSCVDHVRRSLPGVLLFAGAGHLVHGASHQGLQLRRRCPRTPSAAHQAVDIKRPANQRHDHCQRKQFSFPHRMTDCIVSRTPEQSFETIIHMLLYMVVKQRQPQLICSKIDGYSAVGRHDDSILLNPSCLTADVNDLKNVPVHHCDCTGRNGIGRLLSARFPEGICDRSRANCRTPSTERKIAHKRVRMEGWRQRRLGASNNFKEQKNRSWH